MNPKIIKNKHQANEAMNEIAKLITRADLLSFLIKDFIYKQSISGKYDPIEIIRLRMEQLNMRQCDLVPYIGQKSHTSEVLNKKRKLSLEMIRALIKLDIPAEVLVQDYKIFK